VKKIAVLNRKGGVGKSTTAAHLAQGLAIAGRRVILIDCDPQGSLSTMLGVQPESTLSHVLRGAQNASESLTAARDGLFLLAADSTLSEAADVVLNRPFDPQHVLAEKLEGLDADFVILDTAPSFSRLTINAVFYADVSLVPISMSLLAMRGLVDVEEEMAVLQRHGAAPLRYIVPTMADGRKKLTEDVLTALDGKYADLVTNPIRYQARFDELDGETMYEADPRGRGANDYVTLVERILYG
jgi:chromosome partitioning protein